MGSYLPGRAAQYDNALRGYARWSKLWHSSSLSINTAMFDETMVYRDGNIRTDTGSVRESEIASTRLMSDINYRIWVTDYLSADGGLTLSSLSADAQAFGNKINEFRTSAITAVKLALPAITVNASARKEFHPEIEIPPLFSAGARVGPAAGRFAVTASYSDQFRVPTFNDKYWQPGGNPDLLPETGFTADMGMEWTFVSNRSFGLEAGTGAYLTRLENMIHWVPLKTNSWWQPENKDMVSVTGIEASLSAGGSAGKYKYNASAVYNFSRPEVTSLLNDNTLNETKMLRYVPAHRGTVNINVVSGRAFGGLTSAYTGSRHTTADNNPLQMMPPFRVLNMWAGYRVRLGGVDGRVQLRVMNLLDEDYQVVRSYAMPGRTIYLSFIMGYSYGD